jgi:peptidyl-prolyl cis-trans isomerase B (cyclophilin B)
MTLAVAVMVALSILFPQKGWYAPNQPLMVDVKAPAEVLLVLTDFTGRVRDLNPPPSVKGEQTLDLRTVLQEMNRPGTYVLWAVPRPVDEAEEIRIERFVGTPLVIDVRADPRRDAPPGPMVTRMSPLIYAAIETEHGEMTCVFYYDVAPHTVENFIKLASEQFYDGLTFHRILPGFIVQAGDPVANGTGGPGYTIDAEFSDRQHLEGVMSMARQMDPIEREGAMPRSEFANTAGSQFFICVNYEATRQLDRRYTAFGRVVQGMEVVRTIAATPLDDPDRGRPTKPPVIKRVTIHPVTQKQNPYREIIRSAPVAPLPGVTPGR